MRMRNPMRRNVPVHFVRFGIVAICVAALLCTTSALAQEKEKKAKPAKPAKAAAKKAEKPADSEKEKTPDRRKTVPTPPEDPAVAAILAIKPTTPEECVRAAKTLADLKREALAKEFLKKALDAGLDDQQLADLGQQIGLAVFMDLSVRAALQPEAKQLADEVSAAMKARREDSQRIGGSIEQLKDPSAEKRFRAIAGLQEAGLSAVRPLLAVLTDASRGSEHANIRAALVEIGRPSIAPLVAMTEQSDPKVAVPAIQALGQFKDARDKRFVLSLLRPALSEKSDPAVRQAAVAALKELTGKAPTLADAGLLAQAARGYFERGNRPPVDQDGKTRLWRWDAAKQQCVARLGKPDALARAMAVSLARDAYVLTPDRATQAFYLAALLEQAQYDDGLDRPLDEEKNPAAVEAKRLGVKAVEDAMTYAVAHDHSAAAAATARILGGIGTARELLHEHVGPSPLVIALQSPDRRLRLAALEAIVRLQPAKPFAGSSYVPQALAFFVGSTGFRHAIVASPNGVEARNLAGRLSAAGYNVDIANTGSEMLLKAAQSPDYEIALIDMAVDHPVANILLQQLRHDPRTASIRVGLIARENHLDQAERLGRLDGLAKGFSRPLDDKATQWQIEQLGAIAPDTFVSFETRQRQAARALELLTELSRSSNKVYDLRSVQNAVMAASHNPRLAVKAVGLLANINSAQSQQTLVELAGRFTLPLAVRQAAASAFRENTQKHGILLTSAEIRQQYQRYNETEKLDASTQRVMGLILDCLEVNVPKKDK